MSLAQSVVDFGYSETRISNQSDHIIAVIHFRVAVGHHREINACHRETQ